MKLRWIVIAGMLAFGCAAVFGLTSVVSGYSVVQTLTCFLAPSQTDLTQIGQPISDALVSFHAQNGAYPKSLSDLDIGTPTTFYGDWRYTVSDDQQSCTLAIGDYGRYLFEVWWTPENGWYTDT